MILNTPITPNLEVSDLVDRATSRDQKAFGELYTLYADKVYRHVYYLVGSQQEAEDITAQAFMQAWQAIDRYCATGAPFVTWLIRIAHNLAISYHRRRRLSFVLDEAIASADSRSAPDLVFQRQEEQARLMQAIKCLKESQRQVIVLRFIDDLDYRAVAEIMGKSVAAIRVIQHRALIALRRVLEADSVPNKSATVTDISSRKAASRSAGSKLKSASNF